MRIECEAYELVGLIEEATNKNIYGIQERLDEIEELLEQLLEKQSHKSDKDKDGDMK